MEAGGVAWNTCTALSSGSPSWLYTCSVTPSWSTAVMWSSSTTLRTAITDWPPAAGWISILFRAWKPSLR